MGYVIGVDIGSTNIKAVAFDERARLLTRHSADCTFLPDDNPAFREQDPEAIYQAVCRTVAAVQNELKGEPLAVGFSSAMHSLIAVDARGAALSRCISWADLRSRAIAGALRDTDTGAALYERSGTPIHPMSPLLKIAWLQQNRPELCRQAHKYVGIKEYIFYRLLERWIVDYSVASATGLFDIHDYDWNAFALAFAGIDREHLSEAVDGSTVLTGLRPAAAAELGLPVDTPLVIGASDGCLANLGALVFQPDAAVVTLGTSAAIRCMRPAPSPDPAGRLFNYILTRRRYVVGGPSNNGGYLLQWFNRRFDERADPEQRLEQAGQTQAAADGLWCLPYILGERAPLWDPDATGAFIGVRAHHGPPQFYRAMLEGVLFNVRAIGVDLESVAGRFDRLHVNGGLAAAGRVMQMLADIFGVPALRAPTGEASARGAAILALTAVGAIEQPEALAGEGEPDERFDPDTTQAARYADLFPVYEQIVRAYRQMPLQP